MVTSSRKKFPNKRILFQVDRKLVSTSRNTFKNTFLLDEKTPYIGRNI